jgi:BirA family biotin operon repressor/biotin-[acetyl-CoA-carboxylase] ligase
MPRPDDTLFIGQRIISLDRVSSTNDYALQWLRSEKPPEGTVITAQFQTAGRGQRGSEWHGEVGRNLAMSIILYPTFVSLQRQFALSQAVALGCYHCLNEILGAKVRIKWTNDLYYGNKKLGGILIENTVNAYGWVSAIVGIGINVNQTDFPPDLPNPTSIAILTGSRWDTNELMKKLCHYIERQYLQLRADKLAYLHENYRQFLYRYQEMAHYETPEGIILTAKITDVTEQGKLVLCTAEGQYREFDIKEIRFC